MKTYHVGGLNPIHRFKSLPEALKKAQDDDTIILHKNVDEYVKIDKNIILDGHNHTVNVNKGKVGFQINSRCEIHNLNFKAQARSNALVVTKGIYLDHVKTELIGPIREFYPVVMLQGSNKVTADNCEFTNVNVANTVNATFNDSNFSSYYKGDISLTTRSDMSMFNGNVTMNDCTLKSCIFAGPTQLNGCTLDRYIDIDSNNVVLNNCVINMHEDKVKKNEYKKEPSSGPLAHKIDNKYCIAVRPNGSITVNNLAIDIARENFLGFYAKNGTINLNNTNLNDLGVKNRVVDSNLSLHNTHDKNYWQIDGNSPTAYVRSSLNASRQYETAMQKLDKLIGQDNVKHQIKTIMNTIQMQSNTNNKDFDFSYNMIFAGDPGSGKTSIARIVAQALFEVGAIPENKITMATSDEFVKGYIGQSGENTRRILDKALGGVLFIDEAYQLTVKPGEKSFNSDVLSVLIRYMEDHRSDLVVIAAGYNKEMKEFLASNVGLTRRFQWIQFENYTNKELAEIFELMRNSYGDKFADPKLKLVLEPLFTKLTNLNLSIPDANGRRTNGGNGGLVRNVYQAIAQARNNRVASNGGDPSFTQSDVAQGFQVEINKAENRKM